MFLVELIRFHGCNKKKSKRALLTQTDSVSDKGLNNTLLDFTW